MSTTNNALSLVPRASILPSSRDWETMMNMADTLYRSGVLPAHIKNGAAVVAIMQKGKEVGVPPMHALQNIYFVKGKATLSAELMHALVIRDEGPGALKVIETDAKHCTVRYQRQDNEGTFSFTYQEAETAGLTNGPDSMYKKYPAAMLRSRCISACCRFVFPDIIGGMYTPEEMGATVDEDGEVLALPADVPMRATVAPPQPPQPQQPAHSSLPVTRHPGKASAGEIQFLWTTATKCGVTKGEVRNLLAAMFPEAKGIDGSPSTRELTSEQVAQLIATIEEAGQAPEDDEPEDEYAEIAAATDQGKLLPIDGGR